MEQSQQLTEEALSLAPLLILYSLHHSLTKRGLITRFRFCSGLLGYRTEWSRRAEKWRRQRLHGIDGAQVDGPVADGLLEFALPSGSAIVPRAFCQTHDGSAPFFA